MTPEQTKFFQQTAKSIAEQSITLVVDKKKQLPLDKSKFKKVMVVGITPRERDFKEFKVIKEELEARGMQVTFQHDILYEDNGYIDTWTKNHDLIIVVTARLPHRPIGGLVFYGAEGQSVWAIGSHGKEKTIVVSLGSPYQYHEYYADNNVFINGYGMAPATQRAIVQTIFGELPFRGKSPVKLLMPE
jgi:beta-N-acetylhexosaminidase